MKKHFAFSIKLGFESQWILKRPWVDVFRLHEIVSETRIVEVKAVCLGAYIQLNWWRGEL